MLFFYDMKTSATFFPFHLFFYNYVHNEFKLLLAKIRIIYKINKYIILITDEYLKI